MKALLLVSLTLASVYANARTRMVDGIPDENIVQVVEIAGRPGTQTRAALVRNEGTSDLSMMIIETQGAANYLIIDNAKMGLTVDQPGSTNAKLGVNPAGSLLISSDNSNFPSRDMWRRTFTVTYKRGYFVVSGFTLEYQDTATGKTDSCDYNLLTRRGVRNGKAVHVRTRPANVGFLGESEKLYSCEGW